MIKAPYDRIITLAAHGFRLQRVIGQFQFSVPSGTKLYQGMVVCCRPSTLVVELLK